MSGSGPIYEYQRELTAQLEQVMRERDEARAEVERLGAALTQETRLSLHTQRRLEEAEASTESLTAEFQRAVVDCDEARAEVERLQGGFQRGVSAMREAAMDFIDAIDTMNPGYRSFIVASLNSVPVRGDK